MSRESPSDIIHILSQPSTSLQSVVAALYHTLCTLAANAHGLAEMWLIEMLGVITEVYLYVSHLSVTWHLSCFLYRGRARYSQGPDKYSIEAQWKTAHDICSIEALNIAFEDCREGDSYDLGVLSDRLPVYFLTLVLQRQCGSLLAYQRGLLTFSKG